ncbi:MULTISPECIES: response regulator [unclassified Polaribacter]|uniref:response regulator n=1 Tax=unclassified Polaribacter TaxID=196858 RepID=UPI0011BFAB51|nr:MULTISPECIES: response regulator transcription factor [unclassified Polaribacter]TXD51040.1 response regulator transcription factor [Polaribacter sp. IC063]TXD62346.1 response regulator transcription factor [Polaribacter sp. IC066]
MNSDITILVADDHPMLLKGLRDELLGLKYNVLEGATNGAQALEMIVSKKPTIAILDINMPFLTGFEVIKKCKEVSVKTKFILLTSYKEKGFVLKAKQMNISGYLLKDEPFSEINKCIKSALKDKFYTSAIFNEVFTKEFSNQIEKIKFLSPSERTIVRLIANGNSTKAIAEILSISTRTVDKHRSNIISKLDLPSDADALTVWVKENKELLDNV